MQHDIIIIEQVEHVQPVQMEHIQVHEIQVQVVVHVRR